MVKQVVNIGTEELRGRDGDSNRIANSKFQANFNEVYEALGADNEGNLPVALPIEKGGTGAGTATEARENLSVYSKDETTQNIKDNVVNNLTAGGIENALSAEMGKNLQTNKLEKTSNAVSASKLFTAYSFTWTGDVTGTVNFDGSANVTNALTLANTGVGAGTYGSNIKTVTLTIDAKGRVTSASQQDIRTATTAVSGVVQLNDTLNSSSVALAATANAVKKVNDAVIATDLIAKAAIPANEKGIAGGVATLDPSGVIPANQLPSYVDDVLEFATFSAFPALGESGKIYIATETGMTYRWTGTVYAPIGGGAGTSDTALRLFTPRTIAISGDAIGEATAFDGSVNISITLSEVEATRFKIGRNINGIHFDGSEDITIVDSSALAKASNLSDLENKTTARNNLGVYSRAEVYSKSEVDTEIANATPTIPDATVEAKGIVRLADSSDISNNSETVAVSPKDVNAMLVGLGVPTSAPRALLAFSSKPKTGTNSNNGTTVTATIANHGLAAGDVINITYTVKSIVDRLRTQTVTVTSVTNANTFLFSDGQGLGSGSGYACTLNFVIKANMNISAITDLGIGYFKITMTTALASSNYLVLPEAYNSDNELAFAKLNGLFTKTTTAFEIRITNTSGALVDADFIHIGVFL